jgi:hypothetical protein
LNMNPQNEMKGFFMVSILINAVMHL